MEMDVLGADPYVTAEQAENHGVVLVEMPELLERSDVITVHVPLSRATKNLIGREAGLDEARSDPAQRGAWRRDR